MFTLQETQSIHDSMNRPKIEFIALIYLHFEWSQKSKDPLKDCFEKVNIFS